MMSEAMMTQVPDAATPYTSGMRSQRSPAGGPLKDNAHWVTLYTTRRFSLGASDSANTPSAKSTPEIEDQPQTVPIKRPEHAQPAIRARASGVRHESGTTKIQDVTRIDASPGATDHTPGCGVPRMIGSLLLSDALTSKFFSVLFLGKLHVFLMRMCFPSEGCWDLGEVSRSKPK